MVQFLLMGFSDLLLSLGWRRSLGMWELNEKQSKGQILLPEQPAGNVVSG